MDPQAPDVPPLRVTFSREDVATLAKEVYDETVAEVTFSLFTYWVCVKRENYEQARQYIRELGLDQVSASLFRALPRTSKWLCLYP